MSVWGVSMARDEADIIFHTLMHMGEEGLAGIVVADNLSTDATLAEMDRARRALAGTCEVVILVDPVVAYNQSAKMTALAAIAGERGATWVIPFDADELWLGADRLAKVLDDTRVEVVQATLFNHYSTSIDPPGDVPFTTMGWRKKEPGALPKVAYRWRPDVTIDQGNHGVTFPPGHYAPRARRSVLEIRHFPYRSAEQFIRKAITGAAAYAATDLPLHQGAHWRQYGAIHDRLGDEGLAAVFREHFWFLAPVEADMVYDPAPFRRWTQEPASPADKEQP